MQGGGAVEWWNLPCYFPTNPKDWATAIAECATAMHVTNVPAFLVAGISFAGDSTPDDARRRAAQYADAVPGLGGVFLWQFGDVEKSGGGALVAEYAASMAKGLAEGLIPINPPTPARAAPTPETSPPGAERS